MTTTQTTLPKINVVTRPRSDVTTMHQSEPPASYPQVVTRPRSDVTTIFF